MDEIISANIPDKDLDSDAYEAVKNFMIHGPCGVANKNAPCMSNDKCTKYFPQKFYDQTTVDENGFPTYRRRNNGIYVEKKGVRLENCYVVPYNRNLIVNFQAHINVEICNRSRSIKYPFRYVNKGPDKATDKANTSTTEMEQEIFDEIKFYLDCRYVMSFARILFVFILYVVSGNIL